MTQKSAFNTQTKIQLVLTLLCCLSYQLLYSQTPANSNSLLWEITGKGQKPSYIYGTMHVSGKLAFNLNDSFFIGIKNCDVIALEIDPDLMLGDLANSKMLKAAYAATNYYNQGPDGFYEYSFAPKEISNRMLASFLAQRNDIVNTLLYRSNINTANKEEDTYLDLFIFQAGKKLGKKTFGLETFEGTMDMYAQSIKAENELDENEKNKNTYREGLYSMERLEEAYRKGDIVLIDSISRNTSSKMSYKYMVVERNKIMYKGIDSLIQSGASVFTGVGAAHLGGEEGILNILRKNGYTVNPVSWKGVKPSKLKNQIEKIATTPLLVNQYSTDSSFSVDVPGKIHSLMNVGQDDIYLATDMTNGSYYMVSKIDHNGFINKHDKKYWSQKVDSMLYENIDGTIAQKQESTTESGDICFLITSKTRRSDIEKYKIIITPFNIFIFKVAGNGPYANGKEAAQFLNSVKLYPQVSYNNKASEFTYRFTQNNVFIDNNNTDNNEKHIAVSNDGTKYNMLLIVPLNETNYLEEDTFELNYIIDKAAERYKTQITRINIGSDKRSASFEWKKDDELYKGKLFVHGSHYYFMLDNTGNDDFINSFVIQPKSGNLDFKTHTDTSMLFTVKLVDIPETNELASLMGGERKKKANDPESKKERYTCKTTKETISLSYEKLNQYKSYTNIDSLWSKSLNSATKMDNPTIIHKVYSTKNGANILDCEIEVKENAHQYLRLKIVQKGKYIYTLNTLCAKGQSSTFVDTFYNTFSLLDSNYGKSAIESKLPLLLTHIFDTDSTTRVDARDNIYMMNTGVIKPGDFKTIKEALQKAEQSDLGMNERITLIESLRHIKTPECLNWLKANYTNNSDTPAYQFAILYALAGQQTLPATMVFAELIKKETPISEDIYEFTSCFDEYNDSLELIAKVTPQLLFLLDFDEYKERIIVLLSTLKHNNLIASTVYLNNKTAFLNTANIELKKHLASIQSKSDKNSYNEYNDYDDYDEDEMYADNGSLTINKDVWAVSNNILIDYAVLLQPFYQEPNVKAFFDKTLKNADIKVQLSVGALLLKNKIVVEDSYWEKWTTNASTRADTYKLLNNIGRLDKYPASYKNMDSIARSQVFQDDSEKPSTDSVILVLKEQNLYSKDGTGTLYVYKQYDTKNGSWNWDYIFLQDAGNFDIRTLSARDFVNKFDDITDDKILAKIKLSIRTLDRRNCEDVNFYRLAQNMDEE